MKEKDLKNDKPILNWKCIENFDKVSDDKIFYNRKNIRLTERQRREAKKQFDELREKYRPILRDFVEEANGRKKTHLTIAGGNYTFFFVLPKMIEWISRKHPFLGVEIRLFERGGSAQLEEQDADIVLTSSLRGDSAPRGMLAGYNKMRKFAEDTLFFATSTDALEKFGSQADVINAQDVLFSRIYATQYSESEIKRLYASMPLGREAFPRVVVDQYFLECKMITHSVGLGYLFSSMKLENNIVKLDTQSVEHIERFVIMKKFLDKKYRKIARRCIDILENKEVGYEKS